MPLEPAAKRAVVFIDGQNLYHAAKEAFGYSYPNYDAHAIASTTCSAQGWALKEVRFYTGVPDRSDNLHWHHFWSAKLLAMSRQGVTIYSRALRYRNKTIWLPGGGTHTLLVAEEKGTDVRIALDVIRLAHRGEYDVALVFSQDQDLSEAADEVRVIAREQRRWIKIASAFPDSPTRNYRRGIDKTDWIKIGRADYDACIDPRSYVRKPKSR